jgi:hypothetical protein
MESLELKKSSCQFQEQNSNVIPLHHGIHDSENTESSKPKKIDREAFVSWLFLIGSLMFTLDAILENIRGISFSSLLHISASILFTIGSVLFIPDNSQK